MSSGDSVFVISLGCAKNRVNTERVLGALVSSGMTLTDDLDRAVLVLINTCGFIDEARTEGEDVVDGLQSWREAGKGRAILLMGCWTTYASHEGTERLPTVDATLVGHDPSEVVRACQSLLGLPETERASGPDRLLTTPGAYGYLSIADGCDRHCTFCTIPKLRGPFRSVPPEEILREADGLLSAGVRELVIIGQDTLSYGQESESLPNLVELVKAMSDLGEDPYWIRLMYCHPEGLSRALLDEMVASSHLVPYLDIPLQHVSPSILRAMGRRTDPLLRWMHSLEAIPSLTLRTTLMTGFPGEKESDFAELEALVSEGPFTHVGVFAYSDELLAPSHRMDGAVDPELAGERAEILRSIAERRALERHRDRIGETCRVLVDGPGDEPHEYLCRSSAEAPEIDPVIFLHSPQGSLEQGDFVSVRIIQGTSDTLDAERAD